MRFCQDGEAGLAASNLGQLSITRTGDGKALHPSGRALRDGGIGAAGVAVPDQSSRTVETVDRNLHEEDESTAQESVRSRDVVDSGSFAASEIPAVGWRSGLLRQRRLNLDHGDGRDLSARRLTSGSSIRLGAVTLL